MHTAMEKLERILTDKQFTHKKKKNTKDLKEY